MIVLEPRTWDVAIIEHRQVGEHTVAVYDYDRLILCMVRDGDTVEDAEEWLHYNTLRALPYEGDGAPWVVRQIHCAECLDEDDEIVDVGSISYVRLR
jgi:hypothetical protein